MWQNMLKEYEDTLRSNPKDPTALKVSNVSSAFKLLIVNLISILQLSFSSQAVRQIHCGWIFTAYIDRVTPNS